MRSNFKIALKRVALKLKKAQEKAPMMLANEGQKFFVSNFQKEAWQGNVQKKWKPRKGNPNNKKPILIGRTRKLINSVRRSVKEANTKRIVWGTSVPYAEIHNNGYNGMVSRKAHKRQLIKTVSVSGSYNGLGSKRRKQKVQILGTRHNVSGGMYKMRMPQRKFMGASPVLQKLLVKKLESIYKDVIR